MSKNGSNPNESDADKRVAGEAAPPRQRRARNPAVDDVIHTGEIAEPRSRIVRSSGDEANDYAEVTLGPSKSGSAAPRRSLRFLWLAGALVVGVAAGALSFVQAPVDRAPEIGALRSDGDEFVRTIDLEAKAARLRVDSIAATPRLVAAIETDQATIEDLFNDKREHLFVPVDGEVLEIFQLRDGTQTPLFRIPVNAAEIALVSGSDARIEHAGDQLTVVVGASIATQRGGIGGALALRHAIDLTAVRKRVAEHALAAKLVGIGAPIMLASSDRSGMAVDVPVASGREVKTGALQLAAVITPASTGGSLRLARDSCAVLAGLLVVVFGLSLVLKRR
jgi:hypothetical protein